MFNPEFIASLTDLTSLTGQETGPDIANLCDKAQAQPGPTAAICLYPRHLAQAKTLLSNTSIQLATVINFPHGKDPVEQSVAAIRQALNDGADEIDLVMPYYLLATDNYASIHSYLSTCRQACAGYCLKIIIESGELTEQQIQSACELSIQADANFIKTSTGKTQQGASLSAARIILEVIKAQPKPVGIKVSGSVRTLEQANHYLQLAQASFDQNWLAPDNFRFGCSRLIVE